MNSPLPKTLLIEIHRRLFDESFPRLRKCLNTLNENEIWHRPNENVVSVGNLTLHLCGNARQWIISGLRGEPDTRERDKEFSEPGPLPTSFLLEMLDTLEYDLKKVLNKVTEADLVRPITVQGFEENGTSILVHVVEHFSYHVGQITWFVKTSRNIDMGYYAGHDL